MIDRKINDCLTSLDESVKHLNEINKCSKINRDIEVRMLAQRHAPYSVEEEPGKFPIQILPFARNDSFFGRGSEMEKISEHLDWRGRDGLRTYLIYGRRGVGKTQIALEYAYKNEAGFDAIFWIQCESASSLRQSYVNIALRLDLVQKEMGGHFEEIVAAVQRWLKRTSKCYFVRRLGFTVRACTSVLGILPP